MKKTVFLIFLFCVFLFFAGQASASVVYEATVTVTSIKVPARGEHVKKTDTGYGFKDSEFRIYNSNQPAYIIVKDGSGNIVKKLIFASQFNYVQYGSKISFTFRREAGTTYKIYLNFNASGGSNNLCSPDCSSGTNSGYYLSLEYFSQSGWVSSRCYYSQGSGPCANATYYVGSTGPDVWFLVATL